METALNDFHLNNAAQFDLGLQENQAYGKQE